ncbi:MAG: ribonuclease HII [Candidatus Zixiibacteriota bacterium]
MAHLVRRQASEPDRWQYERQFWDAGLTYVAGVDEVGRGPLAGPVVAVAVVLPPTFDADGVSDSKLLSPLQRLDLYPRICDCAISWGVGLVEPTEIDRINILEATYEAMRQALGQLSMPAEAVLVDGKFRIPGLAIPQRAIIDGDALCVSIGCASILAKEIRDRLMEEFDSDYPEYGFARHKGYATPDHLEALARLGPTPIHRQSFSPLRDRNQSHLDL